MFSKGYRPCLKSKFSCLLSFPKIKNKNLDCFVRQRIDLFGTRTQKSKIYKNKQQKGQQEWASVVNLQNYISLFLAMQISCLIQCINCVFFGISTHPLLTSILSHHSRILNYNTTVTKTSSKSKDHGFRHKSMGTVSKVKMQYGSSQFDHRSLFSYLCRQGGPSNVRGDKDNTCGVPDIHNFWEVKSIIPTQ